MAMMKTYKNLKEMLKGRGFGENEAHHWARCLYKYTDCGPWVIFLMKNGKEIYYDRTDEKIDPAKCTGIKIGSIVEGSDVEIGPEVLMFPFTDDQLEDVIKGINDQASFYWERDNSQWYCLQLGEKSFWLHDTWGDIKWDEGKPSASLRKKVEAFIKEHSEDIPLIDSGFIKIPGTKSTIHEYINDTTY